MSIEQTFEELKQLGLQREEFHENMTWDDYVEELEKCTKNDVELTKLLRTRRREETHTEQLTLDEIMSSNFNRAKELIDGMTIAKRISMLKELQEYRDYLYKSVGSFGEQGVPKEEQLAAKDFRILLGRIKHLEILQNWLYGVV